MNYNSDSLKAKLRNKSKEVGIPAETLLKMYMFERLLERISISKYKNNFILKGGFLVSAIFGINLRSTVDIDATISGLPLTTDVLKQVINEVITIDIKDNCKFEIGDIKAIREEGIYSGFEVKFKVMIDKIWSFVSIDVTTGDKITYKEIEFEYETILGQDSIMLMAYNNETIIAEKYEAILSRGVFNTRMKDYYDLYMFVSVKINEIDTIKLSDAINNTATQRSTKHFIDNSDEIIEAIKNSENMSNLWIQYQRKFEYAIDINFQDVINSLDTIKQITEAVNV